MTMITEFAEQLFSFMALKYEILASNIPRDEDIPVEEYDWSTSDEFTVEIGQAVLMLSYSYRSEFRKHFGRISTLLSSSKAKANLYPLIFAKVTYTSHSPLKILVICALISEMYLFLLAKSGSKSSIRDYIEPSSDCFNGVYRAVLSLIDDPILKWKDVKRVASLIASGYSIFRPFVESEHPLEESKTFFDTVQSLVSSEPKATAAKAEHEEEEPSEEVRGAEYIPKEKLQEINRKLYNTLKTQSHRLFPKSVQHFKSSNPSSTQSTGQNLASKSTQVGASCSGVSLKPDSKVEKEPLTTPPKGSSTKGVDKHSSKESTTASNIGKSPTKSVATDSLPSTEDKTASNIAGSQGKAKTPKISKTKLKRLAKAIKAANKSVIIEERKVDGSNQNTSRVPETPSAEYLRFPPDVDTLCSDRLSNLTVREYRTDDNEDESGEESLV